MTVVVAAYNAGGFLSETLDTALAQTFDDLELLVIDDGSRDGTAGVVRERMARDARIRLIVQENRGLAATRNRGVAEARGTLLAFLDHDDLWHPEKLALQVALLDARPRAAVASCYSAVVDERGHCLGWRIGGGADGDVYAEMLEWDMISGGSVVVIRREALDAIGPFDESLPIRSDFDMWIRLAHRFPFATVRRVLVGYRRTGAGTSRGYARMADAGVRVLEHAARRDPGFGPRRQRFCRARDLFGIAGACTMDGELGLAWRYVGRSLAVTPMPILRSPRRWALVAVLVLRTVLPGRAFRVALAALNRVSFQLPPGTPFGAIDGRPR